MEYPETKLPQPFVRLSTVLLFAILGLQVVILVVILKKDHYQDYTVPAPAVSVPTPNPPVTPASKPDADSVRPEGLPDFVLKNDFQDDYNAGRNIPTLADPTLSSPFSSINEKRPTASGHLTLRDRDITVQGGIGGEIVPQNKVVMDFTDGRGTYVTFRFKTPHGSTIKSGSTAAFDVIAFGGDGGHLMKSVSSDGVQFTAVGDDSSNNGHYQFDLPTGRPEAFLRLQVGTAAGIFEGVQIGNIEASLYAR